MPFPLTNVDDKITLIIPFCFKKGGNKIGRYALFRQINDKTVYFLQAYRVVNHVPEFLRNTVFQIKESDVPFLINLFDDAGDHQEEDYVLPVFDLQSKENKYFEGSFKFMPLSQPCSFKQFVLGPPPPSQGHVNELLGFAAGNDDNDENNEAAHLERKRKKSRKSKRSKRSKSRKNFS